MKAVVPHEVLTFDRREQSFGAEAVKALTEGAGIEPGQIFKTLIIAVPDSVAVAIVPATARLSLKAAAAALGVAKALMAEAPVAERSNGLRGRCVRCRPSVGPAGCRRSSIPARWRGTGCVPVHLHAPPQRVGGVVEDSFTAERGEDWRGVDLVSRMSCNPSRHESESISVRPVR
ncbi:hypothetical protein A5686_11205 [Mycobacterium sp. E2479]|nr:hypothetical protein A5686_11205 [Mycobacterium sp. E2479]